jgi:CheY-like chemotaxis protein
MSAHVLPVPQPHAPHLEGDGFGTAEGFLRDVGVLVVEDDFIVAFDMQTLLEEQGARVIGPASDLAEARAAFVPGANVQVAVLDVNLNGEYVFPLAAQLRAAGVPFLFATAYADDDRLFPEELRDAPRLSKPVLPNALLGQLQRLLGK